MTSADLQNLIRERDDFLFDVDGTLVDSSACHERAFLRTLDERCPELVGFFDYEALKGQTTETVFAGLGIEHESKRLLLSVAKRENYLSEIAAGRVYVVAGALELLAGLVALHKRVFLVTGGSLSSTAAVLARMGLDKYVSGLVTAADASRSKPAPDPFLVCLSRFGLKRERCVAVEDAAKGVESARAARLAVIAVNNPELAALPEYAGPLMNMYEALSDLRSFRE